jgi:hypothetical protein
VHLPAAANVSADIASLATFPVGTTFEASVGISAGQVYDHKAIGFSNAPVASNCYSGESESALWRGQDSDLYVQPKSGNVGDCTLKLTSSYGASLPPLPLVDFKIERVSDAIVNFSQDGASTQANSNISTIALPIRFSAYTFTSAPANPVDILVDWVSVTQP